MKLMLGKNTMDKQPQFSWRKARLRNLEQERYRIYLALLDHMDKLGIPKPVKSLGFWLDGFATYVLEQTRLQIDNHKADAR